VDLDSHSSSGGTGRWGQDRLVDVLHRWHECASGPLRGGRFEKTTDPEEPSDHGLGRSRGGFGSKIHLITDRRGVPIAAKITAGQDHESRHFASTMELIEVRRPSGQRRKRPQAIAGDKGFSYPRVRQWIGRHGMKAVIPLKSNEIDRMPQTHAAFDSHAYRDRNVVERCVGWLKECRRIMSRFEKLAINFLTFVHIAMIERLLRIGLSDSA